MNSDRHPHRIGLIALLLLASFSAMAEDFFVDMRACDDEFPLPEEFREITRFLGDDVDDLINVSNATGMISYAYNFVSDACGVVGPTINCGGVEITLPDPASQPNPVPIVGPADVDGIYEFVLDIEDFSGSLCVTGFRLIIEADEPIRPNPPDLLGADQTSASPANDPEAPVFVTDLIPTPTHSHRQITLSASIATSRLAEPRRAQTWR